MDFTSLHGTSILRAAVCSIAIPVLFALLYFFLNLLLWEPLMEPRGSIKYIPFLSELYYSVLTFTTFGYVDIAPKNWLGQVLAIIEIGFGYTMLGVLVSVIAPKMSR